MTIFINSTKIETKAVTIRQLLEEQGFPITTSLVEHNRVALLRSDWTKAVLSENDRIEILQISAGG